MTYKDLVNIVGHSAAREFDIVFGDWLRECKEDNQNDVDPYDTALLMFAAGYVARRNDELHAEYGEKEAAWNEADDPLGD